MSILGLNPGTLSWLTADPYFPQGLEDGYISFSDVYYDSLPTSDEVMKTIERNLNPCWTTAEQVALELLGAPIPSPAYHLGFLLTWLDAYIRAKERHPSQSATTG